MGCGSSKAKGPLKMDTGRLRAAVQLSQTEGMNMQWFDKQFPESVPTDEASYKEYMDCKNVMHPSRPGRTKQPKCPEVVPFHFLSCLETQNLMDVKLQPPASLPRRAW